jgi:hypothetical protein
VGSTWLLRRGDSRLCLFLIHTGWMTHVMMASHRWSHTPPQRVPAAVQLLQSAGVLMSQEHHSDHHASYDVNFAIFGGWVRQRSRSSALCSLRASALAAVCRMLSGDYQRQANPALNWLTAHVMDCKDVRWVWFFLSWLLLPGVMAWPRLHRPLYAAARRAHDALLRRLGGDPGAGETLWLVSTAADRSLAPVKFWAGCLLLAAITAVAGRGIGRGNLGGGGGGWSTALAAHMLLMVRPGGRG